MWRLMKIQKLKFCNELTPKQRNAVKLHGQTFGTIVKQKIPFQSAQDGLTRLFSVTERI
jgi:hypothetical protein